MENNIDMHVPVLFLIFNRPDTTERVFEMIKEVKPPRLYVASDGARSGRDGEAEKVQQTRDLVLSNIDWDCDVKTLFRENNLGCKYAVSSAIDWFFENEEMGIILEDDCLPSLSFFSFCQELLAKYKDDERIGMISGDNFQNGIKRGDADYYFSIYAHIWGWATWANRWQQYDLELKHLNKEKVLAGKFRQKKIEKYWAKIFDDMKSAKIDTWDYQWTFSCWQNNWLTVLPNKNLISNIGFGQGATHTTAESEFSNLQTYEIVLEKHPELLQADAEADGFTENKMFAGHSFFKRVLLRLFKNS